MDTSATLPDGRMYAILAADNRIKPHGVPPTGPGTGQAAPNYVCVRRDVYVGWGEGDPPRRHFVDNEAWTGTDQIRFYSVDGDVLTIKQRLYKSPVDGREGQAVIVWEKVKTPPR